MLKYTLKILSLFLLLTLFSHPPTIGQEIREETRQIYKELMDRKDKEEKREQLAKSLKTVLGTNPTDFTEYSDEELAQLFEQMKALVQLDNELVPIYQEKLSENNGISLNMIGTFTDLIMKLNMWNWILAGTTLLMTILSIYYGMKYRKLARIEIRS